MYVLSFTKVLIVFRYSNMSKSETYAIPTNTAE